MRTGEIVWLCLYAVDDGLGCSHEDRRTLVPKLHHFVVLGLYRYRNSRYHQRDTGYCSTLLGHGICVGI